MSGVWVFKKSGVIQRENPNHDQAGSSNSSAGGKRKEKVLVHLATGEAVSSYKSLEQILCSLGWERYYGSSAADHKHHKHTNLFQFHKPSSIDLISLPTDFSKFNSVHMYDIVVKNPNVFHVQDIYI